MDLVVGSTVLIGLMIYYGIAVTPALFFLPVVLAVLLAFTAGIALLLAMSNLYYRDIKYLFEVAITVWMFATSVVYPAESVGGRLGQLLALNPMTQIIEAFRAVLLYGQLPNRRCHSRSRRAVVSGRAGSPAGTSSIVPNSRLRRTSRWHVRQ